MWLSSQSVLPVSNLQWRHPPQAGVDLILEWRAIDSLPSHSQTSLLWFVVFVVPFSSPWPSLVQQCVFLHLWRPWIFIWNGSVTRLGGQPVQVGTTRREDFPPVFPDCQLLTMSNRYLDKVLPQCMTSVHGHCADGSWEQLQVYRDQGWRSA